MHPTSGEVDIMGYTPWKNRRKYVENIGAVFGQNLSYCGIFHPLTPLI